MMRVSLYSRLAILGLLLTGLALSGCSKGAPTSADMTPEGGAAVKSNKGGDNTRDASLSPAPTGVQTGTDGGKK